MDELRVDGQEIEYRVQGLLHNNPENYQYGGPGRGDAQLIRAIAGATAEAINNLETRRQAGGMMHPGAFLVDMVEEGTNVRIVSDGTAMGTKVINTDTGKPIEGVTSVSWSISLEDQTALATICLKMVPTDIAVMT